MTTKLETNHIETFTLSAPTQTAPTPPVSVDAMGTSRLPSRALKAHTEMAPAVVSELRALAVEAPGLLGTSIDLPRLADSLEGASRWSQVRDEAQRWAAYTKRGAALSWGRPMRLWAEVAPMLRAHMARDPELAERLPAIDSFLRAQREVAKKGVVTRRRKAATNKKPA